MKKFLKTSAKVVGVLLVLIIAVVLFRDQLISARLGPPDQFETAGLPDRPDYNDLASWASHPGIADTADLTLTGVSATPEAAAIDVFYVHPTTYFGPGEWNSSMDLAENAAQTLETVLAGHGTIFNDCCRFYAPRYREAHIAVFTKPTDEVKLAKENSFKALELAYRDVEAAFDVFLANRDPARPFILAGHSQGSLHVFRLMEMRVDGTPLEEKMVAAYPIGFWFSADKLERGPKSIGLCETEDATGCFVTYDTFGDAGPGRDVSGTITHWYKTGWEWTSGDKTLCVNPISWRPNTERAEKNDHQGAMPLATTFRPLDLLLNRNNGVSYDALAAHLPGLTWAQCDAGGTLYIESQNDNVFAGGIDERQLYHSYDWQLFYMDIKANVENRIERYLAKTRHAVAAAE